MLVFLIGCNTSNTSVSRESITFEIIELNERTCKGKAFDEIELDFMTYLKDVPPIQYSMVGAGLGVNDLDNDGLIDIFLVNFDGPSAIYWNRGNLTFEKEYFPLQRGRNINIIDYNGDGRQDLFITVFNSTPILFENTLSNNKVKFINKNVSFMKYSYTSDWSDIDLDGDLDLVVATLDAELKENFILTKEEIQEYGVSIFYNTPFGFEEFELSSKSEAHGLSFYDINNDHYPDIFVGNDFELEDFVYFCNQDGCN